MRALELQRREVLHYHALLGGAGLEEQRRLSWMDEWDELAGYARIEPPRGSSAVRRYVSKYVVKGGDIDLGGPLGRAAIVEPSLWDIPLVHVLDRTPALEQSVPEAHGPTLWDASS